MKKKIGIVVDILMYIIMLAQMLYVFEVNLLHEILGMSFFACLIIHIIIKRKWITKHKAGFKKEKTKQRWIADIFIWLLMLDVAVLCISSMGVSRTLFPDIKILGSPALHTYLATGALALMVLHGGMHMYIKAKKKKRAVVILVLLTAGAIYVGLGLVPYLNRHFKKVEISDINPIEGNKVSTDRKVLTVYFTRVGNTDFDDNVDAVSGASLLINHGVMMGNAELLADMVQNALDCDKKAIKLTGQKYPSSYNDTINVASKEIKNHTRPEIEKIDSLPLYDTIILVYPIWWFTIPEPVATFLESYDFSGKTVYLLATQGSSGFASSTKDIKALIPNAEVIEGLSIYCDDIPYSREIIGQWLEEIF